jgi:DNA-binding MarR family transcriptional regulator
VAEDLRAYGDPGSDDFRVDNYPFYLLNRTVSRYNVIIEAELRAIGIDIPTWRVLMILGEAEPQSIGQVAKLAVINVSTLMRVAERMEKAGLIETLPSATDGRVTTLAMKPLGREKLKAARAVTAPLYRRLIRGFSAPDFRRLIALLNRLQQNLE